MSLVFVVGVGRSGTSLLQSMLASHPAVAMLPETAFFRRIVRGGHQRTIEALRELREADARLQRIDDAVWSAAMARVAATTGDGRRVDPGVFYRALLEAAIERHGVATIAADKDPRLLEFGRELHAAFPDSHMVHIVRDPRAVLASKMKAEWSRSRHWILNAMVGRLQMDIGDAAGRRRFGWRYHVVRYEDLVRDPRRELTRLCHELDIDFDEQMLAYTGRASRLMSPEEAAWKSETTESLMPDRVDAWTRDLSRRRVRFTEAVMRRWMKRYGYEPAQRRGPASVAVAAAADVVVALYRLVRGARA